jgi:tetratricopeptide (TPR) repeat protein
MADADERERLACWLGEPAGASPAPGDLRVEGESRFWAGDLDGALASLDEAARRAPSDPWVLLSRAAVRFRRGELDLSARDAAAFRRLRPDGAAAPAVEAMLAAARGDKESSGRAAGTAVERSSRAPWALALRGALRGRWGDLDGARDDLDAALALETSAWALAARADALNRLGYFWLALEDLDRLRGLLPGDPEPDVLAAAIHRDQAQFADALRRLSRAEAQRPGEARFAKLKSEVLFVQGKLERAVRELERALRLAPDDAALRFERVRLLALSNRQRDAEAALKAARLSGPAADFLRGYLLARRRKWPAAGRLFAAVASAPGPEADALRERARLYQEVARQMPGLKAPPRPRTKEFRMTGLGYRQPFQTTVEALRWISSCDLIYSNLSDSSVVDFVGLFGLPFRAIVFRRSDQDAVKCAKDVMPGFRKARVVGVVTRGHPLYYGRLAWRLAVLSWRRGYTVRVPASTSIADVLPALAGGVAGETRGLQVRDCSQLEHLDRRLPLILYNFSAVGPWRAELSRKLAGLYGPEHPVLLLAGSGDREFSPFAATAATLEAALERADEAVTILLPPGTER